MLKEYVATPEFVTNSHMVTKGVTFDASKFRDKYAKAGTVVGIISATGKARPVAVTTLSSAVSTSTTLNVADASWFVVGDSITVGSGSATTITDIDYDNNVITVADAQTADAGETVKLADGAQVPVGIVAENVSLEKGDNIGAILVHGFVDKSKLANYDASFDSQLPLILFE